MPSMAAATTAIATIMPTPPDEDSSLGPDVGDCGSAKLLGDIPGDVSDGGVISGVAVAAGARTVNPILPAIGCPSAETTR